MADVVDPLSSCITQAFVVEVRVLPVEGCRCGRFEIAFMHEIGGSGTGSRDGPQKTRARRWSEALRSSPTSLTSSDLIGQRVEGFLKAVGVRALGLRQRLEPVGDLVEAFFAGDFAMPGYMSVYSWVSPAIAAFRLSRDLPIGRPVAGSPTASRYSRWPWA